MKTSTTVLCLLSVILPLASPAAKFCVTPYLQRPSTDAMTIIFFTDTACKATVAAELANAAGTPRLQETTIGVWAQALTNNVFHLNKNDKEEKNKWNNSLYRHRVRFEGLKPNRFYNYTVTLDGGATYSNTFRTAPDKNTPIRFVSYADCETTSSHFNNYTSNLKKMQSREPDLITAAGDLTARGGIQSHWDEFWMQNAGGNSIGYTDILGSIPMLTAIGNHDLFDNADHNVSSGWFHDRQGEVATEKFLSYFEVNSNNVAYAVRDGTNIPETRDMSQLFHRADYGPVTLIFLDTNNGKDCKNQTEDEKTASNSIHDQDTNYCKYTNGSHEPGGMNRWKGARHPDFNPDTFQYAWLTNQLADAQQKSRFTFVFNHHCPYSIGDHNKSWSEGEDASALAVRVLTETMVRYGVDGWYCGHDELLEHSITNGYEILPDGQRRKHTLSIYDLGCSGDSARSSSGATNPLAYWKASGNYGGTGSYGFLETDVTTNKLGQWTCTITPVQGSTGNYVTGAQIVYVENPDRGENENDLVYAEYAKTKAIDGVSATKPSDWLAYEKGTPGGGADEPVAGSENVFSVSPYVQHPTADGMTILFFTTEPCEATVKCWPVAETATVREERATCEEATNLGKNASDDVAVWGAQYKHRVRFEGLAAGTRHCYAVEPVGSAAYTNFFSTVPDRNTPVRFVAYSDSECIQPDYKDTTGSNHATSDGRTEEWDVLVNGANQTKTYYVSRSEGFASNLVHMAAWKTDLFVIAGDLVARGGVQMFWDEFWKENAGANAKGYGDWAGSVPILATVGNHDLYDNTNAKALSYNTDRGGRTALNKFLSYFEFPSNGDATYDQQYFRQDYGPVTLLFIDTNNGTTGSVSPSFKSGSTMYKWLEANLADAQKTARFTFVVQHHCPYSRGKHNKPTDGQTAVPIRDALSGLMTKYGVTAWIGGHEEMQEHATLTGEEVLPDGTTRSHTVHVYDLGSGGDGLKGNPSVTCANVDYRAYGDSPDGTHYGHLQVEVKKNEKGLWTCTMAPAYSYMTASHTSELRYYTGAIRTVEGEADPAPPVERVKPFVRATWEKGKTEFMRVAE